jgi:hypothetical protein
MCPFRENWFPNLSQPCYSWQMSHFFHGNLQNTLSTVQCLGLNSRKSTCTSWSLLAIPLLDSEYSFDFHRYNHVTEFIRHQNIKMIQSLIHHVLIIMIQLICFLFLAPFLLLNLLIYSLEEDLYLLSCIRILKQSSRIQKYLEFWSLILGNVESLAIEEKSTWTVILNFS